ncbi:O-antigen ligase family protein [Nesterenkonia sp. YGD6]|uniref:O-antigen ligase family protein n=1 Tax=Nesterenkonia sp. YGD6 TaxID=2901231 RepID=UPI001F4D0032|nr:O-antigen ligase family protein [Nesterenkonia sp. YGD6]MCH8563285.1 O-antigen ligase family protein [Nesterenkonia sp. YGD6]
MINYTRGKVDNRNGVGIFNVGPGEIAIAGFIFTTIFFSDGHAFHSVSRIAIVGVFLIEFLSGKKLHFNPFLCTALVFVALSAASLAWTAAPESSSARVGTLAYQLISYIALINLVSWRKNRLDLCLTWIVISALAAGSYVVLIQGITFQDDRSMVGVISAGQLALACAAGVMVAVFRFSETRRSRYLLAIAILSVFLLFTSSRRGLLLILFFLAIFYFFGAKGPGRRFLSFIGGIIMFSVAYALVIRVPVLYEFVGQRLEAFVSFLLLDATGDASVQGRSSLVDFSFRLFQDSPYLGHGVDSFRVLFSQRHGSWYTSADNNYLELLAGLGILGFFAYYIPYLIFVIKGLHGVTTKSRAVHFALAAVLSMAVIDFATVWIYSRVGLVFLVLCYQVVYRESRLVSESLGTPAVTPDSGSAIRRAAH